MNDDLSLFARLERIESRLDDLIEAIDAVMTHGWDWTKP